MNARRSCLLLLSLAACAYGLAAGARLPRWLGVATASAATTYTVTTNADGGPGSLRQAITDANASAGTDTINFSLPAGQLTITLLSDLPVITGPVVIDGTTQPGYAGTPVVELDGNRSGRQNTSNAGLMLRGSNSTVRGLVINRFAHAAIILLVDGGHVVENCYIGVDPTGTQSRANLMGINVPSTGNRIGGPSPAQRNVISGNDRYGIDISVSGNVVQGNYIGTNAQGTAAIANGSSGGGGDGSGIKLIFELEDILIGGTAAGAGNVISGNFDYGISSDGGGSVTVQGNFIGTDATGRRAVPNRQAGIRATGGLQVGGTEAGARNVISGNTGHGILIENSPFFDENPTGVVVEGNYIGVASDGTSPLPNALAASGTGRAGVFVRSVLKHRVGGIGPGQGNVIAFNGSPGVIVAGVNNSTQEELGTTTVRGNSIFSNLFIGIDLNADNVTPNDANDADLGPNSRQNFPVVTAYSSGNTTTTVSGTLASRPSTLYDLDFYANRACDPSGNGEGGEYLGSSQVTTDAAGSAGFNVVLAGALLPGRAVTATATAPDGSTSEFSPCDASRAAGGVAFQASRFAAIEDVGTFNVQVLRPGNNVSETITVGYETFGGTATEGVDYLPVSGTLTFAPGERQQFIPLQILNDSVFEATPETIFLRLTSPGDPEVLILPATTTIDLFDSSTTPTVSALPTLYTEGSSGGPEIRRLFIGLSAATIRTVTVDYATIDDSSGLAAPGADYLPTSGTVTFNPGETRKEVPFTIIADRIDEFDETFRVAVFNPVGANLGSGNNPATMTIRDDDEPPGVQIGGASVLEGDFDTTEINFPVTLTAASGKTVTVQFDTAGVTAIEGVDFDQEIGTVTFAPGETQKTIAITVRGDTAQEPDESFRVDLFNPANATIVTATGTGVIRDDERRLQFSATAFQASEGAGRVTITVTRTGFVGTADDIRYGTVDDHTPVPCAEVTGKAFPRCDYSTTIDTLTFAAGETTKTFTVPLIDDSHAEGAETFEVFFEPLGTVPTSGRATVTIADNEAGASGPNPIDTHQFFVRQHYLDFLSREPEVGEPWTKILTDCPNAFNTDPRSPSALCDRNTVSSAFFRSPEFELKGLYVFRFYVSMLERLPRYDEIISDMRAVTGQTPEEVFRKRAEFAERWPFREEFSGLRHTGPPGIFVLVWMDRAKLTQVTTPDPANPEGTQKVVLTTQQLAERVNAGTLSLGQAARAIADSDEIKAREFNRAFVAMQYFGYLRRDPEQPGFDAWLAYLNANPQDFRTMIDGFMNSVEYRLRFGPR